MSLLGWTEIPAIVRELDDRAASAVMLAENLARVDLDPIAEATAYAERMEALDLTVAEVAEMAGLAYFAFVDLVNRLKVEQRDESTEAFAWKIDDLVADVKAAAAAKSRSTKALIAAMAEALEAAGVAADLVAEAKATIR